MPKGTSAKPFLPIVLFDVFMKTLTVEIGDDTADAAYLEQKAKEIERMNKVYDDRDIQILQSQKLMQKLIKNKEQDNIVITPSNEDDWIEVFPIPTEEEKELLKVPPVVEENNYMPSPLPETNSVRDQYVDFPLPDEKLPNIYDNPISEPQTMEDNIKIAQPYVYMGKTYSRFLGKKDTKRVFLTKNMNDICKDNNWRTETYREPYDEYRTDRKRVIIDNSTNKRIGVVHLGNKMIVNGVPKIQQDHYHLDVDDQIHYFLPDQVK